MTEPLRPPQGGQNPDDQSRPLDFSRSVRRTRTMLDAALVIAWNSFHGDPTSLAVRLIADVATDAIKGTTQGNVLHVSELSPGSKDLVAKPVEAKGPSTITIKWVGKKKKSPRVDLTPYLLLRRFSIPRGMKAYVPIERPETGPPRIIFWFSKATFAPIDKTRRRKSSGSGTPENPGSPGSPSTPGSEQQP
jgi:hypothetical protein